MTLWNSLTSWNSKPRALRLRIVSFAAIATCTSFMGFKSSLALAQDRTVQKNASNTEELGRQSQDDYEPVVKNYDYERVQFFRSHRQIPGLKWDSDEPRIETEGSGDHRQVFALLQGKHLMVDWQIRMQGRPIVFQEDGSFTLRVPLQGVQTNLRLEGRGPQGENDEESLRIIVPRWAEIQAGSFTPSPVRPGVQVALTNYQQAFVPNYEAVNLNAELSADIPLNSSRWTLGAQAYITIAPLSVFEGESGITARFAGGSAHLGYRLPGLTRPWSLTILGGAYYSTMLVTSSAFGYQNVYGPQIAPVLERALGVADALQLFGRFSVVGGGSGILDVSANRELATGVAWKHIFESGHSLSLYLGYSSLNLGFSAQAVNSNAISFGPSLEW